MLNSRASTDMDASESAEKLDTLGDLPHHDNDSCDEDPDFGPSCGLVRMPSTVDRALSIKFDRMDLEPEWQRRLERFVNAITRAAGAGLCIRGGAMLVAMLLKRKAKRKAPAKTQQPSGGGSPLQTTLRFTAFLAAFAGIYTAVDEGIAALFGNRRTAKWRAAVAGAAAGPTLLLTGPKTRHTSIALYALLRGLGLLIRTGNKADAPPLVHKLLAPTRWRHGDTALMCISASQIIYSWILHPDTLAPSYVKFLNLHGGTPLERVRAIQSLAMQTAAAKSSAAPAGAPQVLCSCLHGGTTCDQHFLQFLPDAIRRAFPVYVPVYVLPALLVHRQRLLGPKAQVILPKIALGIARSSLFLALYCALVWRGACTGAQLTGKTTGWVIAASVWPAGLATIVEKKSRRMELAYYCLSRALEAFGLCTIKWGLVRHKTVKGIRMDVLIFSAATAAILHCYSDGFGKHRDVFASKYLNVFDWLMGSVDVESGIAKHKPLPGAAIAQGWVAQMRTAAADMAVKLQSLQGGRSKKTEEEEEIDKVIEEIRRTRGFAVRHGSTGSFTGSQLNRRIV